MMRRLTSLPVIGLVIFCVVLLASVASMRAQLSNQGSIAPAGAPAASPASQAQDTPVAGTAVVVRMVDAVDSGSDPVGKQYRASVTRQVNASNNVIIAQGAAAIVMLARNGSNWTAQLTSLTINNQAVAVTSTSANLTAGAQNAVAGAANAVGSVLGGFGRPKNVPSGVAAVATGQRVLLPPGTTLNFVLGAAPAASAAPSNPAPAASAATNTPATAPSAASANGHVTALYYCYSGQKLGAPMYFNAPFEVDATTNSMLVMNAFGKYLLDTYPAALGGGTCLVAWSLSDYQEIQKHLSDSRIRTKPVDIGWRYGQPPVAPGQVDSALTQNRQAIYYCEFPSSDGTTRYVSGVFQADWDNAKVSNAFWTHLKDAYKETNETVADACRAGSPQNMQAGHDKALASQLRPQSTGGSAHLGMDKVVKVDWKYTPDQAAVASAKAAQAAAPAGPSAAQPSSGQSSSGQSAKYFISCSTYQGAGVDWYFTDVFPTDRIKVTGHGMASGYDLNSIESILNDFQKYLTQKGYKYLPGTRAACDVSTDEQQAKAAKHRRAYEGNPCGNCGKVVETGWKE